jgi:serine phosphatase RsbU (regulator of sigma subunit)/CHASE3 domain sensor protein
MVRRPISSPITATVTLALILVLLVGGGLLVRTLITRAFDDAAHLHETLGDTHEALVEQLDEETGIRGYAVTRDPGFLEPFLRARTTLPATLDRLGLRLRAAGLDDAAASIDNARAMNRTWMQTVAFPLMRTVPPSNVRTIEATGKSLVDRYRADLARVDIVVGARLQAEQGTARAAIDRIDVFVAIAALLVALAGVFAFDQQRRVANRVALERRRAEEEVRATAVLRAAVAAEKRITDSLQEAIGQHPLPTIPTLRFSASYVPATDDTNVGGDWYDAFELPNDRVLFVIGDVTGHGLNAAVGMNRARQSLVSAALLESDPAAVLHRVNDELCARGGPLVTAIAGFADARTHEFVYAAAGHPPPLLVEPDRVPRLLECGSLALGAALGTRYKIYRVPSVIGATLVLYTDGAVEHSRNVLEGEEQLIAAATGAADQHAADAASFIHAAIFAGRPVGDDVAILTIGFASDTPAGMNISGAGAQMPARLAS